MSFFDPRYRVERGIGGSWAYAGATPSLRTAKGMADWWANNPGCSGRVIDQRTGRIVYIVPPGGGR
jgi:hypothetical protein